ncbi:MAG: EF-hand domain-containing protein, partial [Planctomycetota bacterium]
CQITMAQRPLQRKLGEAQQGNAARQRAARLGKALGASSDDSSTDKRNDVEGAIWEFKVLDTSSKNKATQTKMTGKFRVKQSSLFAVGSVTQSNDSSNKSAAEEADDMMNQFDKNGDKQLNASELTAMLNSMRNNGAKRQGANTKGELDSLISQKIKKAKEEDTGGERIGDLTKSRSSEKTFRFDEDDNHPLSGIAVVQPDTKKKNGVWYGRYDEFSNGKKKKRWRIEMRKIED